MTRMMKDENNIGLAQATESVDSINARFYGRFQFPHAPASFYAPADPQFETVMLNQSIGSWDYTALPGRPKIWVAGCGTNQSVYTALRFPEAAIVASDLSAPSLATAARTAQQLKVAPIEFRNESINNAAFREEFDYVICTGVIHHNADPRVPLARLAAALKPGGILELMVYNRYHRIMTTAFQKAIRTLMAGADFDRELRMARKVVNSVKGDGLMAGFLKQEQQRSEPEFADSLLQPVEYAYTVESLEELCASCGLELLTPCINQFDKAQGTFFWNLDFDDEEVTALYDSLPDLERWKIANQLMMEKSPMLWFYVQRRDSGRPRISEPELCRQFLDRRFVPSRTTQKHYFKASNESYAPSSRPLDYPGAHPDARCQKLIAAVAAQPGLTVRSILEQAGIKCGFSTANKLRLCLTTGAFPYLRCA
jgi:SAM-dependent methyltransferase